MSATQSTSEFLVWAASDEGHTFYQSHRDVLEPEDMRMLVAFHRLGGEPTSMAGLGFVRALVTMLKHSAPSVKYFLSLLTPDELEQIRRCARIVITEDNKARQAQIEQAIADATLVSVTKSRTRQVRLADGLQYWSPDDYLTWCESEEGRCFYWLKRRNKEGGPASIIGDCKTPEETRAELERLRVTFRTDASDECAVAEGGANQQLFQFLQYHQPHSVGTRYPQTFLYAVSLLTPLEYQRFQSSSSCDDDASWKNPSNSHPNAITMRWINSPEAVEANANAAALRAAAPSGVKRKTSDERVKGQDEVKSAAVSPSKKARSSN